MSRNHKPSTVRSLFEPLEPRKLLATFVVTNANDNGPGSLRDAVSLANNAAGADVIEFDESLAGSVIPMNSGNITLRDQLTIRGLGADNLRLSGESFTRVFSIDRDAEVIIEDLTLRSGYLDNGLGGLIYNDSGASLELRRVTLEDSRALSGGAIYNNFGSITIDSSTFSSNVAGFEGMIGQSGGAIHSAGGPITVINSTFVDNFALRNGGAIYSLNTSTITGSTFARNRAGEDGGALFNGAAMTITNTTISGNEADVAGGAVYNWWSLSLEIYNSTIVSNTSPSTGGVANVNVSATITSTIIAQNAGGDTSGSVISTSNLIGGDPMLGPLAYNGGPTQTHALLSGSPAIGNGVNPLGLTTDQRGGGFARAYNGGIDIGAFQRQPITQIVDTTSDVDNGNYAPGDLSLREAISRSNSDPEFFPTITFDASLNDQTITLTGGELQISASVEIQGPGRNLLRVFANYGSRLLYITADEVSISGMAFDAGSSGAGGAIYAATSRLTLTDVGVLNSQSTGHGGGLYIASGDATISDSVFNENTANGADRGGGGIYAQGGTLTINSSQITNNSASFAGGIGSEGAVVIDGSTIDGNTSSGNSGGVEVWNLTAGAASLIVRSSSITNNTAADNGGGVRVFNSSLTINSSTISGNTAGGNGGGVDAERPSAEVNIRATRITDNSAFEGGGLHVFAGNLVLHQSEISENVATDDGGGVRLYNATQATIRSSTISGNEAGRAGAGVSVLSGTTWVFNSTVVRNLANTNYENEARGGGLHVSRGIAEIYSTILYRNERRIDDRPWRLLADEIRVDDGGRVSGSHNLVYDESTASGLWGGESTLVGVDPRLAGLAENGGPTRTHALLEDSPAIDAGSNPQSLAQDQRGENRVQGTAPDIGAYESAFTAGFSLQVADGGVARSTSLANGTHLTAARNENGQLIVFFENGGGWSVLRMSDQTSAPAITSDPIIWTDPNDGLAYVAAPSADGFLLFRRDSNGQWTFRDLADQTGNRADAPTGTLAHFITRPRSGSPLVYITGINARGEIVAYSQNAASRSGQQASWSLYNISDDLASQGMATPAFTKITTYVTSWNQWTLAGLDSSGNVQGVWVNVASFTTWRVDNLSTITGADPLTGELDVTLTTWGGIRFAGANASGQLVATWWNPALGPGAWKQTDLSSAVPGNAAPALSGGQLTAWFTPTDRISYAGYDNNADVVSFYWQPGDGGSWSSTNLTSSLSNRADRPVGRITTHVASDGEASIVGVSSEGALVRLWTASETNPFRLDNLSDIAQRV